MSTMNVYKVRLRDGETLRIEAETVDETKDETDIVILLVFKNGDEIVGRVGGPITAWWKEPPLATGQAVSEYDPFDT